MPGIREEQFINEVETRAAGFKKIRFEIKTAMVNKDAFRELYHEFLVPGKGYAAIVQLHDEIYSKALHSELRPDIDFIPHIGIVNSGNLQRCTLAVDALNSRHLLITGIIEFLTIVKYENGGIVKIKDIGLC